MRITYELLLKHSACGDQAELFRKLYPDGLVPTVEALSAAAAAGLDAWWAARLLPAEGPGSQRAYALWCAERVAHLATDGRVRDCLAVVRRRVGYPASVTDDELRSAEAAAEAAAWAGRSLSWAAARSARSAAWAAWSQPWDEGEEEAEAAWAEEAALAAAEAAAAAGWAAWAAEAAARAAARAAREAEMGAQFAQLSKLLMEAS